MPSAKGATLLRADPPTGTCLFPVRRARAKFTAPASSPLGKRRLSGLSGAVACAPVLSRHSGACGRHPLYTAPASSPLGKRRLSGLSGAVACAPVLSRHSGACGRHPLYTAPASSPLGKRRLSGLNGAVACARSVTPSGVCGLHPACAERWPESRFPGRGRTARGGPFPAGLRAAGCQSCASLLRG